MQKFYSKGKPVKREDVRVCPPLVQAELDHLFSKMSRTVSEIDRIEQVVDSLPVINDASISVKNKKGIPVGTITTKGVFVRKAVVKKNGVWYFDGNRAGRTKQQYASELFDPAAASKSVSDQEHNCRKKVWARIRPA